MKHVAPSDVRPVTTSHRDLVKSNIKDVICPMILSHRYPDDVLFFIFEDDFELFPKGVLPQDTSTQVEHSSSSSRALRPGPYVRAAIGDKQMGEEKCANAQQETSVYAEDMVKIVTMAARKGHGDLVWLGFNGKKASSAKAKMMVGFGSQLVAITKPAARNLLKFWEHRRPGHVDVELLAFCNDKKHPMIDVPFFGHRWEATGSTTASVALQRASELLIGISMWHAREPGRSTIPKKGKSR